MGLYLSLFIFNLLFNVIQIILVKMREYISKYISTGFIVKYYFLLRRSLIFIFGLVPDFGIAEFWRRVEH